MDAFIWIISIITFSAFCIFFIIGILTFFIWVFFSDYTQYSYGFCRPVKGYINKVIKPSCIQCQYRDGDYCNNPKVLELEARNCGHCVRNYHLYPPEARKYSIFCYKREKMKTNS